MDHVERNRYVRPQTVLSLSWTPMTLNAELLLSEYDHLADPSWTACLLLLAEFSHEGFPQGIQVSQEWRGPCIVLAREGNSRLHLSHRGVQVLVTPEQTRHASRDEAELIAHEDLLRELSGLQRGSQRGFIDERRNAPGDPLHAEERHPEDAQEDITMDQVNDESGPQQDAPAEPLDPLRSAENEDASHEDEQGHAPLPPSREPDTSQANLGPHHSVEQDQPVAQPHVEADLDESTQRPEERDQDNMDRTGRVRPRESDTREAAPVRRRLRKCDGRTTQYKVQALTSMTKLNHFWRAGCLIQTTEEKRL